MEEICLVLPSALPAIMKKSQRADHLTNRIIFLGEKA